VQETLFGHKYSMVDRKKKLLELCKSCARSITQLNFSTELIKQMNPIQIELHKPREKICLWFRKILSLEHYRFGSLWVVCGPLYCKLPLCSFDLESYIPS
jgi:hypothetical protein